MDCAELMARSDFFVLPSHGETFGLAVAEAICMGLPVITTRGTACEEFVTADDCVLVNIGDVSSLVAGIRDMLARHNGFDRRAIAERARRRFSHEAMVGFYGNVFRRIAGGA